MSSSSDRVRWRRHRERARAGKRIFALELDIVATEEMLIREQLLPAGVEHDPRDVDAALAAFVERLVEWGA